MMSWLVRVKRWVVSVPMRWRRWAGATAGGGGATGGYGGLLVSGRGAGWWLWACYGVFAKWWR